ncbi:putative aspartate aminotransferase, cytoplasmic [Trachymyrmex cornetzi]|uniref:Aspartate aminotransferase n=1 Tax=Trachymyrmex cornetzi TaxID=471704 RepID=A0A151IXQ7_9HYME|nr:putative aspartate aminotransferase, cytoplasmic [Trachymyrmex cornetzi]
MMTRFTGIELGPPIEVFALQKAFVDDTYEKKVNLTIGAYRTNEVLGLEAFSEAATSMLLGANSPVIAQGRAFGIQSLSGTGALRVAAEFLNRILYYDTFYYSKPSWENHRLVFTNGGFKNAREYTYWNEKTRNIDLEGMLRDLRDAPENAVIILHSCAHNPTGCDPTPEQWTKIADVIQEKHLFPLFDSAYQGFASGDLDKDAYAVRMFAERGIEFICTQSFAKNFGLYNERVGNIVFVLADTKEMIQARSQLTLIIRGMYSNPPNHGARIVATVLKNPEFFEEWKDHIKTMSSRIKQMRVGLHHRLLKLGTPGTWDHIIQQIGMFSYTGLTEKQVQHLRDHYHIYMLRSGRINMCGLNENNLDYVANAINETIKLLSEAQNDSKTNSTDNQSEDLKTETKQDNDIFNDDYDEIEEKLKQICDGREEMSTSNVEELNSIPKNWKGSLEDSITQPLFHKSINYKYSSRNEIGDMLTDNRDNIEIIFGSESSEEFVRVPRYTFSNNGTNENDKQNQHTTNIDSITNDKELTETECIENTTNRENLYVASNTRTAVNCEEATREEIVKSIKTSVQDTSFEDTNSMLNSDTSTVILDVEVENELTKELNISETMEYNKDSAVSDTTKFTVKVTGDREDVVDIMQDLFKDTQDFTIQEHNNTCLQQKNNASVTSIITINDYPLETTSINKCNDIFSPCITSIASRNNDQMSDALSSLQNDECLTTRLPSLNMDEEKDPEVNNAMINSIIEQPTMDNANKCEYEKLQQKVKLQETIIGQLTNQLILLKDLEKKWQNKNLMLKARTKKMEKQMNELNKSTDGTSSSTSCKKLDSRQKLIYDLSHRMSNFEEMNKKLMKTVTIESQQKRQLENQIKQRDKQIKELNWKLDKASKYLERAEKNTNTYRRKMLNMQTFMRRRKLLDGSTSEFYDIMVDCTKENYSEKILTMAVDIKEICGTNGYKKLLNYGFPLPTLSVLQALPNNGISDISKSNNKIQETIYLNTDEENDTQHMKNDVEVNTNNHTEHTTFCVGSVMDGTETVTGTVQDIFDESNDDMDDLSTNELSDHFFLQLNAVI